MVTDKRPRAWNKRAFAIAMASIVVAVFLIYLRAKALDRPLVIEAPVSIDARLDYENGKGVDMKKLYDLRQNDGFIATDDNGWRSILQTLGPLALEQKYFAERIPWEKFPTDERTERWFATFWTPVCERFGLDPKTPPTLYDRQDLYGYLLKYGVGIPEIDAKKDPSQTSHYFEDRQEKESVITLELAEKYFNKVLEKAWTAKECPTAARWLEDNADLYDIFSSAVRKPQFRMWRVYEDKALGMLAMQLPDVQYSRQIARYFAIRANYRVGQGDFDGAIDDIESVVILAKDLAENQNACIVEQLVMIAILSVAASIELDANNDPGVRPTLQNWERLNNVWFDAMNDIDFDAILANEMRVEHDVFLTSICQDLLKVRREHGVFRVGQVLADEGIGQPQSCGPFKKAYGFLAGCFVLVRGPFDDALFMQSVEKYWNEMVEAFENGEEYDVEQSLMANKSTRKETRFAGFVFDFVMPALDHCKSAYQRAECFTRIRAIDSAILRYEAENGALPPAFTVDANGKRLHSWRTLILPYLGEEARALYEKIDLNEPWDSDANKRFAKEMPSVFRCPSNAKAKEGQTTVSVLLGEDTLFDESGVGKDLAKRLQRKDVDARRQALVIERSQPVDWMDPNVELSADEWRKMLDDNVENGTELPHACGVNVGLVNGAVLFQSADGASLETRISGVRSEGEEADVVEEVAVEPVAEEAEAPAEELVVEEVAEEAETPAEELILEEVAEEAPAGNAEPQE